MIVMRIEIDDGRDLIDIKATKYHRGDPTHSEALEFLAGERMLMATAPDGVAFVDRNEIEEMVEGWHRGNPHN